ncbi:4Fe-4S dicluster domain-containing protein [Tissierella creatinini]|nr:4Fe-4S dicluster domain-containing protein [Tissierella creatinini]TJX64583.1 4Fe-4S dicluster domain-containing protein [Soehngenia saccharolytica]
MNTTITSIYFSPTENTKRSVESIAEVIEGNKEQIDITVDLEPKERLFSDKDLVIFGAPVYAGRIPSVSKERFMKFKGSKTPCLIVVTYGNRHYDDALLELSDLAEELGFVVKGAAALIGRHTYGEIQTNRPSEEDFLENHRFATRAIAELMNNKELKIPGNQPYKDGISGGRFHPLTSDSCIECGICVKECPVQAIDKDFRTINGNCISCFSCIRKCPKNAKNMDTEEYQSFAKEFSKELNKRRENEYFF